ncbi:MAG: DNA methyltransferase [Firmicutes bacterium]|nr:DNA methyltransferase [Bacillota bacterium]
MQKFNIIYADPPWEFKTYSERGKKQKSAECHYRCMKIEDIYSLPVSKIADDNCVLFLWVTFPLLQEGLEVIRRWGFTYKTCAFNLVKRNKKSDSWFWGLGKWTRSNSEICLLATMGQPKRISCSVHQVCDARIMRHSQKPDEIRKRIVELCGDLPRIELFAREKAEGWVSVGDEIDGQDIRDVLVIYGV